MAARHDRKLLGTMDAREGKRAGRKPMMAGNWKMNLNHLEAIALTQKIAFSLTEAEFEAVEVVVLPPFTDLRSVQTLVEGDRLPLAYGAQDLSVHDSGAYTGEISGAMLAKLGCSYVLVGHSERRQYHGEDDALVNDKVHAAFRHAIVPLVCVGEGLDVRRAGEHVPFTLAQVRTAVKGVPPEQAARLVVAYEPVWAIGTGESAQPEDAQEMAAAVRGELGELYSAEVSRQVRILYGGSVKGATCPGIMTGADVDGALVGGASLSADDFTDIVRFEREHT